MKAIYIHSTESKLFFDVIRRSKGQVLFKDCTADTLRLAQKLRNAGWREAPVNVPFDFSSKIREFLSALNVANAGRDWWTLNIADKNPLASSFCSQVLHFHAAIYALANGHEDTLIVLTKDRYFIAQLKLWARKNNYAFHNDARVDFKERLKQVTPLGPLYALLRTVVRHTYDRFLFRRCSLSRFKGTDVTIFCSLVYSASFKGDLYNDVFFQPLLDHMKKEVKPYFIFSLILEPYMECARKLSGCREHDFTTVLYWLRSSDLIGCFLKCIRYFLGRILWNGNSTFEGQDVSILIRYALKEDYFSTKYFTNSLFYASAKRLFSELKPARFIYPFEMHPWEKLMISALREENPNADIVGYQCSAFTQRHLNLIFSEEETRVTPLPNRIVTPGLRACDILRKANPFLAERIVPGCALRQSDRTGHNAGISGEKDGFDIFVAMSSNMQEHVRLICIVNECSEKLKGSFHFFLRVHPAVDFAMAVAMAGGLRKGVLQSAGPLHDALRKADLVIYASSTVALEALILKKPLIFINTGNALNPDPLFDFSKGRISVSTVDDCVSAIEYFKQGQGFTTPDLGIEGKEYASNYFLPVSTERLNVFLQEAHVKKDRTRL